jgi:cytochrome c peroxidase
VPPATAEQQLDRSLSAINAAGAVYEARSWGGLAIGSPELGLRHPESGLPFRRGRKDALFVGGNFWDGRATGEHLGNPAADQALGPFLNPLEQALAVPGDVVTRICTGPYGSQFTAVWGAQICDAARVTDAYDAVGRSIAAFEGSSESNAFSSKFDLYRAGGARLTPEELLGLALFKGKAKCAGCHVLDGGPNGEALFTDFTFDNIGVPKNPENPFYGMPAQFNPAGAAWLNPGLGGFLETRAAFRKGRPRIWETEGADAAESGPPTLAGFVKAYGHNGYFKTLAGIVEFLQHAGCQADLPGTYTEAQALAAGCWPVPEIAANVNRAELGKLHLTRRQELAIVAFLKTLSDGYHP